nr:Hermansky-Pudlak syndrome 4 protein-like [Biomphalaria glabrata]
MFKMAAGSRNFSFRHEGHMFFIYNHKKKTEEDDPKDAILYFYPRSVSVNHQVALVGGIIGLADFCLEFIPQCVPSIVKLAGYNFALLQHEDFIIGLADSPDIPDQFLTSHLQFVWTTFMLYQGSLDAIKERVSDANFLKELNRVWDMYLPLCQIQGDLLSQAFQVLPYVQLHKSQGNLFLHASHILQRSLRCKGVIAGALFNRNKVLCTQLNNNLTRQLLLLMSHSQFPCVEANSLLELPGGVRLLYIFLPQDEYASLGHRRKKSYTQKTSEDQDSTQKPNHLLLQRQKGSTSGSFHSDGTHGRSGIQSIPVSPQSRRGFPASPTATVASGTDSEVFMDTVSELNFENDSKSEETKITDSGDNKPRSFRQSNLPSSTEIISETSQIFPPPITSDAMAEEAKVKPNTLTDMSSQQNETSTQIKDVNQVDTKNKVTEEEALFPSLDLTALVPPVQNLTLVTGDSTDNSVSFTPSVNANNDGKTESLERLSLDVDSLEKNDQYASKAEISVCSKISYDEDLIQDSDVKDDSDEKNYNSNRSYSSTSNDRDIEYKLLSYETDATFLTTKLEQGAHSSAMTDGSSSLTCTDEMAAVDDANLQTTLAKSHKDIDASLEVQISSEETSSGPRPENYDGSQLSLAAGDNMSASRDRLTFEMGDSEYSEGGIISPVSDLSRLSPVLELTGDDSLLLSPSDYDVQLRVKNRSGRSFSAASDSRSSSQISQRSGLQEILVYAQGHSDTLLVLLLSRSAKCSKSFINSLWKSCLSHLAELDFEVKDAERHVKDETENIGASFQYIKYDSFTQSLKGSALLPITSLANEIVDSSVKMHKSFTEMPDLQDITYRSHSASCYGHRSVSSETYFQLSLTPSAAGICSPQDKTFSLEQIAEKVLQKEAKISML